MGNLTHLKPIFPDEYDMEIAAEKRFEIVKEVGIYYNIALPDEKYRALANDKLYIRDAAYLAYAKSLKQRIQSSIGGVYILALWRQFAWFRGRPIKGFELRAADILEAMERVRMVLIELRM